MLLEYVHCNLFNYMVHNLIELPDSSGTNFIATWGTWLVIKSASLKCNDLIRINHI